MSFQEDLKMNHAHVGLNETDSTVNPVISSDHSVTTKRKKPNDTTATKNPSNGENKIFSRNSSSNEQRKEPKMDTINRSNSLTENKIRCIVRGCERSAKLNSNYCSSACIRRHINDMLECIQRSKGKNYEQIPTRADILLYETKTKTFLEADLVPRIEDLCTWINQHPSYELMKSSSRQTVSSGKNHTRGIARSLSSSSSSSTSSMLTKTSPTNAIISKSATKPNSVTNQHNRTTTVSNRKPPVQIVKPIINKKLNVPSTDDIRSKVPTALYDKIVMRLEKSGENKFVRDDIRILVVKIEEEMFRVYGKVDNAYKNKFRSLIANISNMNNNFFYKKILSNELTAKEIVAMKAEDMLPPEEKEKRKDQFDREVQMIIDAQQKTAEEMARRKRIKITRQGLVDNDTIIQIPALKELASLDMNTNEAKVNESTGVVQTNDELHVTVVPSSEDYVEPTTMNVDEPSMRTVEFSNHLPSFNHSEDLSHLYSTQNDSSRLAANTAEQSIPVGSTAEFDNDYIEPESPTGIDALIYNEDDDICHDGNDDDEIKIISVTSCASKSLSPDDDDDDDVQIIMPCEPVVRDDYNPSKIQNETPTTCQSQSNAGLVNQWRGTICFSDVKISCQSNQVYGENNYLIAYIPEQLTVLGRLRLGDLWSYVRESLTVRDILILTLSSSTMNTHDSDLFSRYVDTLNMSGRAFVISKCTNSACIRDMYILAANTTECPSNILSLFCLPTAFEEKQLLIVIIGSGKRVTKSLNHSNENASLNNVSYNPIALQDATVTRDPRLLKSKDPRLNRNCNVNENNNLSAPEETHTQTTSVQYSNDELLKLINDSLERIRHSEKSDDTRSIVTSTVEILQTHGRDDLCIEFNNKLHADVTEWQNKQPANSTVVVGDNLTEENMDVDDEQEDKPKKLIMSSSNLKSSAKSHDTDYHFLGQDTNQTITTVQENSLPKPRRKSRFSDRLPTDDDQAVKLATVNQIDTTYDTKVTASKSINASMNSLCNSNFPAGTSSHTSTTNAKERSAYSQDVSSKQAKPNAYESLAFSNGNSTIQRFSMNSVRSTTGTDFVPRKERKVISRFSSNPNGWRSNCNNSYVSHYYDFDRPQE